MTTIDVPVLIAGGGPVGTVLAMDLARLGVEATVVEQRRGIPPNPKCNTTNARSMELLRRLGCADAVRRAGLPAEHNTDVVYMSRLDGVELVRYERSTAADVFAGTQHGVAANWPTAEPQHFISQLFLEPVLRDAAENTWGVEVREGWELAGFTQDDGGVTSQIRDVDTGETRTVRSSFLVGADGGSSLVRHAIDSHLEGIAHLTDMCSWYIRAPRISELAESMPGWMLRSFAGRAILVAIDGADGWLVHVNIPQGEDPATWNPEAAMFEAVGEPFDYEILDESRWVARGMVVDKWREGRVFLAGDAAHLWVPMGGFGMNAGIADATALSWRLAAVLQGWGGDALADSYGMERAPIGEAIVGAAVGWVLGMAAALEHEVADVERLESDADARQAVADVLMEGTLSEFECPGFQLGIVYRDSPVIVTDELSEPATIDVETYRATSWPGARLPHVALADGTPVFDRLGDGFTLLRVGADAPAGDTLVAAAAGRGVPLEVVEIDADVVGDAWDDVPLVLVRPDQHVAWRSVTDPDAIDADAVFARVTGWES